VVKNDQFQGLFFRAKNGQQFITTATRKKLAILSTTSLTKRLVNTINKQQQERPKRAKFHHFSGPFLEPKKRLF
jgi:hypothetical protein